MSLTKRIALLTAPVALLAMAGCATPFRADVARFQALPAPQGQTFIVQPVDPSNQGSLEFQSYAQLVSQRLAQQGFRPAADARSANLVVMLDYGVDNGRERIRSTPGFGGFGGGYGPWGYGGFGRFGYGRHPFYYGWNDPWLGGGYTDVSSYTVYTSFLDMRINRAADGQSLFEGSAKARSRDDNLTYLVPNLVEAMFTGFPGNSGEEIRITIPPPERG